MSKKPGYFLLFKIIGIVGAVAAVGGIILAILGFGDFESNNFMIGTFVSVGGVTLAAIGIATGFAPEIAKARAKTIRYIQEENKDDLSAIASNNAEIMSDANVLQALRCRYRRRFQVLLRVRQGAVTTI